MPQSLDIMDKNHICEYQRIERIKWYHLLINLFIGLWYDRYMAM